MKTFDALSDEKLVHRELDLERQLLDLSFRKRTGQLEDTSKLGKVRRDIARVRTAERARERVQGLTKDALRGLHRGTWSPAAASEATVAAEAPASSASNN